MPEFGAKDVKALRDATGAGMMDAKKALTETDGDMEAATQLLREKGMAKAAGRTDRENAEGAVAVAQGDGVVALVHVKCETDFSAKSDGFLAFTQKLADAVLADGAGAADALTAELEDLKLVLKENIELGRIEQIRAADGNLLDTYLHSQDGRGVNAVVVEGSGVSQDDLHQVALHIAFAKPSVLTRDEVDAAEVEAERASLLDITKAEGKPEQAWDKIVEGRLTAWFADRALLEQGLHGEKTKVADSLGGGSIVRFVQAFVGG
ncbi:MAG: translation elongation factor Ts [Acidimicrobiales bacterium]|nr:translation elongation factor Ts [Acidimicrobiales bacterium]